MPAPNAEPKVRSSEATVSTPTDLEIVITRAFRAPRSLVFEAWTKPEHVAHWWDPDGHALDQCEIDLRTEGAFRFVHAGERGHTFGGVYREIKRPDRIVFATPTQSGGERTGTLEFRERDGVTTLTMTIACETKADRDQMLRIGVADGTQRTLENLANYLQRQQR
ncbi:MAG TPA: SRPBCC domain-containing protein [Gemmatimonadaceae bacterium]|nr:SRPBCC domain-containing protein [Gemmatimonadaceae bacterium]